MLIWRRRFSLNQTFHLSHHHTMDLLWCTPLLCAVATDCPKLTQWRAEAKWCHQQGQRRESNSGDYSFCSPAQESKYWDFCLTERLKRSGNTIWWHEHVEETKREGAKQYPRQMELTGNGFLGRKKDIRDRCSPGGKKIIWWVEMSLMLQSHAVHSCSPGTSCDGYKF